MKDYWNKRYKLSVKEGADEITVDKLSGNDWSDISMTTNDMKTGTVTIRSKQHAEALHFMLGQLLEKP